MLFLLQLLVSFLHLFLCLLLSYLKNNGCIGRSGNVGKVIFQGGRIFAGGEVWPLLLPNTPLAAIPGDFAFLWQGAGLRASGGWWGGLPGETRLKSAGAWRGRSLLPPERCKVKGMKIGYKKTWVGSRISHAWANNFLCHIQHPCGDPDVKGHPWRAVEHVREHLFRAPPEVREANHVGAIDEIF